MSGATGRANRSANFLMGGANRSANIFMMMDFTYNPLSRESEEKIEKTGGC